MYGLFSPVSIMFHVYIIEINLVSLCFIKIYKISYVFLYLSSYGKAFKMVKASRCTII